ncbi:MAG: ACT domain-containing protein [Desulfobacterales bacterium]|nr:ACT domain-containing protein [Desulfobacterales bacterium]MDD4072814.1 ACT domain-containing protein [Desulfobacterales bacterium]MDD4391708.1 ACT domain-containing protein [Desulfobacterales bacterium]
MIAYQLSVKAKNRPGFLAGITDILSNDRINIRAITITSFTGYGIINLLVDEPEHAERILRKEGFEVNLKKVLAVLIDDRPGGLNKLLQLLAKENINVEDAYGFVLESRKNAVFVIDVHQFDNATDIIEKAGYKTLNAAALAAMEPFHYLKY